MTRRHVKRTTSPPVFDTIPQRALSVSTELLVDLLACRLAEGIDEPAEIDARRVASAEAALECQIPDDLIAAWAALATPPHVLREWPRLSPESTVAAFDFIGGLSESAPTPFIPLIASQDYGAKDAVLECVSPRPDPAGATHVISVHFFCWTPRVIPTVAWGVDFGLEPVPLGTWLRTAFDVQPTHVQQARKQIGSFRCGFASPSRGTVEHPMFGSGEVIEELSDRLLVRFSDGKTKRLLRSALKPQ